MFVSTTRKGMSERKVLGTIAAIPPTPNTEGFVFVLGPETVCRTGDFVTVESRDGRMIGTIREVEKSNKYYERIHSILDYEASGTPLSEQFPVEEWEATLGAVDILGVIDQEGEIHRCKHPPSPGETVLEAAPEDVIKLLQLDMEKGLNIGRIEGADIEAKINMGRLLGKHFAVLAMSGAGKSYFVTVVLEELLDRPKEHGRVSILVIDPHGEYKSLAEDPNYRNKVDVITLSDVKTNISTLPPDYLAGFLDLSDAAHDVLARAMRTLSQETRETGGYTISELKEFIEQDDSARDNVKAPLLRGLSRLESYGLFSNREAPSPSRFKPGKLVVLDLSDTESNAKRQLATGIILRSLFEKRKRQEIPPILFVVEEAHNFAPTQESGPAAISRKQIETIAREGRKFHACLCLVTQRPVFLSQTALAQCNTHIILRVTNPNDLKYIRETSEGLTSLVVSKIPGLAIGEAIVVGEAVGHPVFVKVRKRRSRDPRDLGAPLEEAARAYEEKLSRGKSDALSLLGS